MINMKNKDLSLFQKYQLLDRYQSDKKELYDMAQKEGLAEPDTNIIKNFITQIYNNISSDTYYSILFLSCHEDKQSAEYSQKLKDYRQFEKLYNSLFSENIS